MPKFTQHVYQEKHGNELYWFLIQKENVKEPRSPCTREKIIRIAKLAKIHNIIWHYKDGTVTSENLPVEFTVPTVVLKAFSDLRKKRDTDMGDHKKVIRKIRRLRNKEIADWLNEHYRGSDKEKFSIYWKIMGQLSTYDHTQVKHVNSAPRFNKALKI